MTVKLREIEVEVTQTFRKMHFFAKKIENFQSSEDKDYEEEELNELQRLANRRDFWAIELGKLKDKYSDVCPMLFSTHMLRVLDTEGKLMTQLKETSHRNAIQLVISKDTQTLYDIFANHPESTTEDKRFKSAEVYMMEKCLNKYLDLGMKYKIDGRFFIEFLEAKLNMKITVGREIGYGRESQDLH